MLSKISYQMLIPRTKTSQHRLKITKTSRTFFKAKVDWVDGGGGKKPLHHTVCFVYFKEK